MHTNGGYLTYVAATMKYIVDYQDDDVWFCSADIGWVTGHSYAVYGPLWAGVTTVIFEGLPTYPEADRYWAVCEKHHVNRFYTAPTVIRMLAGQGTEFTDRHELKDLKWIGSVGEPIDPTAWEWYYKNVGKETLPALRHVVADGDRRPPHLTAAGRQHPQAGFRQPAVLRRQDRRRQREGRGSRPR